MPSFLSKLLDLIRKEIPSQRLILLLFNRSHQVIFRKSQPYSWKENDGLPLKKIIKAIKRMSPVVIEDSGLDVCLEREFTSHNQKRRSVLCLPFLTDGGASGAFCLEREKDIGPFSSHELKILIAFLRPLIILLGKCVDWRSIKQESPPTLEPFIVGQSQEFHRLVEVIEKVKDRNESVFICGESGTGKELVARAIHQWGARKTGRFVAVNCGAIPEFLLESELFGHVRGAFTGAVRNKPGLIEEADGGTFFLDEIGDLSPHLQAKLLRLLQEKEIRRIGENRTRRVDVRFVSATNKHIEREIENGKFREDLYYRLKIITIELSPLRERREDLLYLLNYFLEKYCREMGYEGAYFSPRGLELLLDYKWPGNVRELQSEIQRCLILSGENGLIREDVFSQKINPQREVFMDSSYDFFAAKAEFEKRFLHQALARWNYNRARTAEEIGLSRQGLFKLIKKHQIPLANKMKKKA